MSIFQGACKSLVNMTSKPGVPPLADIPADYQPCVSSSNQPSISIGVSRKCVRTLRRRLSSLENTASADRSSILDRLERRGGYAVGSRRQGAGVAMGDRYDVHGQAGAVGPNAHVHDVTFNQI